MQMENFRETPVVVFIGVYDKIKGRLRDKQTKESALLELIKASELSPTMYQAARASRMCRIPYYVFEFFFKQELDKTKKPDQIIPPHIHPLLPGGYPINSYTTAVALLLCPG